MWGASSRFFDHVEFKFTNGNLTLSSTRLLACIAQCGVGGLEFHRDRAAIQFMRKFAYLGFCLWLCLLGIHRHYEWADIDCRVLFYNPLFILKIYFVMQLAVESGACEWFLRKS